MLESGFLHSESEGKTALLTAIHQLLLELQTRDLQVRPKRHLGQNDRRVVLRQCEEEQEENQH